MEAINILRLMLLLLVVYISKLMYSEVGILVLLNMIPTKNIPRDRRPSKRCRRDIFTAATSDFGDSEFRRHSVCHVPHSISCCKRYSQYYIKTLVRLQGQGGVIDTVVMLAINSWLLACASYIYQMMLFKVGRSTFYSVLRESRLNIKEPIKIPRLPIGYSSKLVHLRILLTALEMVRCDAINYQPGEVSLNE